MGKSRAEKKWEKRGFKRQQYGSGSSSRRDEGEPVRCTILLNNVLDTVHDFNSRFMAAVRRLVRQVKESSTDANILDFGISVNREDALNGNCYVVFANRNQAVTAVNKLEGEPLQVEKEENKKAKGKNKRRLIQAQLTELTNLRDEECTKYIPRNFKSCNKRDGKLHLERLDMKEFEQNFPNK